MELEIPLSKKTVCALRALMAENLVAIQYSPDETQVNNDGGELSLELRIETNSKNFQLYGEAFLQIERHDLPQLAIKDINSVSSESSWSPTRRIDLCRTSVTSAFVLWHKENYAGTSVLWKDVEYIAYANGVLLNFQNKESILLTASISEPDVLIMTKKEQIGNYIQSLHKIELFY